MANATTCLIYCSASQRPCSVTAIRPRRLDNGVGSSKLSYFVCSDHVGISAPQPPSTADSFLAWPASEIEWALARWVRATLTAAEEDAVALDGKTVRGAALPGQVAPHLLAFCTHESQETLLQVRVSEKTNEIPVAQALLPCLALHGRVYTADALHTQRAFTQAVIDLRGYYLPSGEGKSTDLIY